MELFLGSVSVAILVLTGILIAVFVSLRRSVVELGRVLGGLQGDLDSVTRDLRAIGGHVAELSGGLRHGLGRVEQLLETLGGVGDDIDRGRRWVKGGLSLLGPWVSGWLGKADPKG